MEAKQAKYVRYKEKNSKWYTVLYESENEYILDTGDVGTHVFGTHVPKDKMLTYEEYMQQFVKNKDLYKS